MHILYDHQIFALQEYGGISRYIYEIATRIAKYEDVDVTILALAHINKYLMDCTSGIITGRYVPKIPKTSKIRLWLNDEITKRWLSKNQPNIVHETYYLQKRLAPNEAKTVITVYDMIREKFSSFFADSDKTALFKAQAVKRADHVICISENTRNDLIELLNVNPKKVSVVYLGCALKKNSLQFSNPLVSDPYLLYVGPRGGYKNFLRLIKAYVNSSRLNQNFKLVCFGGGSFSHSELNIIQQLGLEGRIKVTQISGEDNTLANLYLNASVFVYPSLYEGFGIPLLEAMSLQCPVVCSNTSALPEVAGNAAEYFEPDDIESIISAIEKVVYSTEKSKTLIALGSERVKRFSWEYCAEQTLNVYSSLV